MNINDHQVLENLYYDVTRGLCPLHALLANHHSQGLRSGSYDHTEARNVVNKSVVQLKLNKIDKNKDTSIYIQNKCQKQ